ncbi:MULTISPECIES: helix-turn-helix domain-containing protein [unclassified Mesorhizobium]|uniref:helix-turn-helix domain-containing protein n=1 Tax=unclassified Mesorhizobium TaxID=325217 RepID=UPI0011281336|nr:MULTISPECIES: helix-turn-helix domain-containing protein [unclassified Mesorhizobium]TPK53839.1 transposase [Mesorhizobium sp. B2-5-2]TPL17152.1 transposase [Mesorhizobium sp. B2-4-7]TPL33437.1 transposase [Mesorhizobium sp. B2-4-5]TPM69123.1 transposase [Mesorhizobium sp. B2-1-6]TPN73608.1 transposase [Mesorhizobium sp. B1-1-2]
MEERLKFVARLLDGEKMAVLCREFDISRKTGYKILARYNGSGLEGLTDRSRRPYRHANQLPFQIEKLIVRLKQDKPTWGAPKIRERLARLYPDVHRPAISTVHAVLDRHGLVEHRKRRRNRATGTPLSNGCRPNDLWCADYKGEFMLADRRYCYPLTITDFASRYLIACEALSTTKEAYAFTVFESVFKEFGLPSAIRTDNGVPFASPNALFNLSKLSVWWLRLGIDIERIKPGCPQQNGRHERMHLTLKKETTKPAGANFLQQQARFDDFIDEFNSERPHQALDMDYPAERYAPSTRPYAGLPDLDYPFHDKALTVTTCGRICYNRKKINLSLVFAGQIVGIKEVEDHIWLASFMDYDLGYFDDETCRLEPLQNPFGPKVLPMSPV